MFDRLWWFLAGLVAGGLVTTRALRQRPSSRALGDAAQHTAADLLDLVAILVRPKRRR